LHVFYLEVACIIYGTEHEFAPWYLVVERGIWEIGLIVGFIDRGEIEGETHLDEFVILVLA
jgi:hypothetical protein